ncbi:MAG TPA: tetraacyldisaccharide 4'-kinase [Alphaproteobacteria bacterium]|jgi:tetraacyldisaccharide 4'-kinase|nr:tetraacyldisaccharide 4'-kinase [Alphaproteobacteria bacterium]
MMRPPAFWDRGGWPQLALMPASWMWSAAGWLRARATSPTRAALPVICIGNVTVGGAGKTPTALTCLALLGARFGSEAVHAVTRGYGGALPGPVRVDPERHTATEVGDEALLLARVAPTWVARDRVAGAQAAAVAGAKLVVLDDGFQNPTIAKDASLLVVDGAVGFGNGRVMPAGPLRESLSSALDRADAVIVIGDDTYGVAARVAAMSPGLPILSARIEPDPTTAAALKGARVIAFAGIGRPEKFFATLADCGADIVARRSFPDHHYFTGAELAWLGTEAERADARLVTTEKDWVRLDAEWRARVTPLPIALAIDHAELARVLEVVTASAEPVNG